jgi:two-component system chemotaxis response regulator CheY
VRGTKVGRILIAEDEEGLCEFYDALLTMDGHTVIGVARDGISAVRMFKSADPPPDVLLLDHYMPGITGLEAARQILKDYPSACIVMITADNSIQEEASAMGVRAFLTKPLGVRDIESAIERLWPGADFEDHRSRGTTQAPTRNRTSKPMGDIEASDATTRSRSV